jgi:hypothetical protein
MEMVDSGNLAKLIERQWNALTALHELAVEQQSCLGAEKAELLLSLIARKQPLVEELDQIRIALQPYREQDPELRQWPDGQSRKICQAMSTRCDELHQEVLRLENVALTQMELQRNAIAAQLQDCRDSTIATTAYATDSLLDDGGGLDLTST